MALKDNQDGVQNSVRNWTFAIRAMIDLMQVITTVGLVCLERGPAPGGHDLDDICSSARDVST